MTAVFASSSVPLWGLINSSYEVRTYPGRYLEGKNTYPAITCSALYNRDLGNRKSMCVEDS